MKRILFATSEAVPFIKTGGLADVAGALPKCFDKRYFDVRVILPKYACMKQEWKDYSFLYGSGIQKLLCWHYAYGIRRNPVLFYR